MSSQPSPIVARLLAVLQLTYWSVCGAAGVGFWLLNAWADWAKPPPSWAHWGLNDLIAHVGPYVWPPTKDPILNFIIGTLGAVVGAAVLAGSFVAFLVVGVAIVGVCLVGLVIVIVGGGLTLLAAASPTGAVVVVGLLGALLWVYVVKPYGPRLREYLARVLEYLAAFVDFVLHPRWGRRGAARTFPDGETEAVVPNADDEAVKQQERELRADVAQAAEVLGVDPPAIPAATGVGDPDVWVQLQTQYAGWFREARKRIQMRSMGRTQGEQVKLLEGLAAKYEAFLKVMRKRGEIGRLDKEKKVEDLKLEEQELDLQRKIKAHQEALEPRRDDAAAADRSLIENVATWINRKKAGLPPGDGREAANRMAAAAQSAAIVAELKREFGERALKDPDIRKMLQSGGIRVD